MDPTEVSQIILWYNSSTIDQVWACMNKNKFWPKISHLFTQISLLLSFYFSRRGGNLINQITDTVGISNPTLSGFRMVKKRLVCKMVRISNGIWNPEAQPFENWPKWPPSCIYHLKSWLFSPDFEWSCFQMAKAPIWKPDHLKTNFQKGRISDPHCNPKMA